MIMTIHIPNSAEEITAVYLTTTLREKGVNWDGNGSYELHYDWNRWLLD